MFLRCFLATPQKNRVNFVKFSGKFCEVLFSPYFYIVLERQNMGDFNSKKNLEFFSHKISQKKSLSFFKFFLRRHFNSKKKFEFFSKEVL
jgi:hypothetical protein